MLCSISGTVPEEPVISKVSGHLYERRLAEKHVQDSGKDPVTGEPCSMEDLLPVKTNKAVKPRPSNATSVPGLLGLFHNEWDAVMLECHTLRSNLQTVRQELSHALYQHDAACRVIGRLMKERDEARKALVEAEKAAPAPAGAGEAAGAAVANGKRAADEGEEAPAKRAKAGVTDEIVNVLSDTSANLSKGRKKRQISPALATPEDLAAFALLASQPLHKTTQPGICEVEVSPDSSDVVATAGADATVQLFDRKAGRILASLTGHSKRVNSVAFVGGQGALVSGSADKTVRVWRQQGERYTCAATLKDHQGEVVAVTVHPSNKYCVTASADKTWAFYDVEAGLCLTQVADPAVEAGYTAACFHPDGLILGTGTAESLVRIWEVRQQKNVAKFEGHSGPVTALSFSENGYYLATAAADSVKLWDLRKLRNFKTLNPYEGSAATAVSFDHSGLYLAVAGADARVYGVKQDWGVLKTFTDVPAKGANAVRFGADAKVLYVGAADHNLRIYGPPAE